MLDLKALLAKILLRITPTILSSGNSIGSWECLGLLIQWGRNTQAVSSSATKTWNTSFSVEYKYKPVVFTQITDTASPATFHVVANNITTTGCQWLRQSSSSTSYNCTIHWVAIGFSNGGGYLISKFYSIFSHLERWWEHVRFKGVLSEDIKRSIQSCRDDRLLSTCKLQRDDTSRWFNALYQITRRSLCGFLYSRCKNETNTNGVGCSKDSGEQSCIGIYKSILLYIKRWWHIQILLWKQPRVLAQCYGYLERKYRLSSWRCSTNVRYGRYNIATISERGCVAC